VLSDLDDEVPLFITDPFVRDFEGSVDLGQLAPLKVDINDRSEDLRDTTVLLVHGV
jgi:hypothetical protein